MKREFVRINLSKHETKTYVQNLFEPGEAVGLITMCAVNIQKSLPDDVKKDIHGAMMKLLSGLPDGAYKATVHMLETVGIVVDEVSPEEFNIQMSETIIHGVMEKNK